ncbi:MAG: SUMF1/EgtB/PvdO family nonheme iron enzyme [Prevotellaceae bacterium]|jgi:formylglycine-generating enzyme required for sulfatase activity|nr:SUMF1/EgtB/PvdO family nonheme iron enzyme [Prevotellaceae bacterium]
MKTRKITLLLVGFVAGILAMIGGNKVMDYTSSDKYCLSCHIHPHADQTWKLSSHYNNPSGMQVHCVDCHLPPESSPFKRTGIKIKTGLHDLWAFHTKDSASFDWERKKRLDYAPKIVFNESCEYCHSNIFTKGLSSEGAVAHLYYDENKKKLDLQCINCHLDAGHYNPNYKHERNISLGSTSDDKAKQIFDSTTKIEQFANFVEQVPGTSISFNMIAIPRGNFSMGSPESEPYRNIDEGPIRKVTVNQFFMAETEVTWEEYLAFYSETKSEGRIDPRIVMERNSLAVDGISGPTPPYGQPDQGWGYGDRPAVTMSYYAAETYCKWLSSKTGKKYRLPTEAEWEYAARAGSQTPYFFDGNPKKFTADRWWNRTFGLDTAIIASHVIYAENSGHRTETAKKVAPNRFGLKNMSGNVMEYCSDFYAADAYSQTPVEVVDPKGPSEGSEHVVRGGSYSSDAKDVRSAARDYTHTDEWLKTDPQSPKSIWWLSDCTRVGFRVVCQAEF